jgi:hypothetical protein
MTLWMVLSGMIVFTMVVPVSEPIWPCHLPGGMFVTCDMFVTESKAPGCTT